MKKIFALLIVLLVGLLPVNAQRDVQKEMNRIKSSPNYVYGEATRADREEALDAAFEEMMHEADQWAAEQTHDKDVELSSDDVRELVESLETKRGSQTRVLTCVKLAKLAALLCEAGYKVKFKEQPEDGAEEPAVKAENAEDAPEAEKSAPTRETANVPDVSIVSIEGLSDDEILDVYLMNGNSMTPEQEATVERAAARVAERNNVVAGTGTALEQILAVRPHPCRAGTRQRELAQEPAYWSE